MWYFEVGQEVLKQLRDAQLEELVARLAEAEVASRGFSPSCVHWSGSTDTPDGGVDVRVAVPSDNFEPGFLPRPNSIFQAKTRSMPPSKIAEEMQADGRLAPSIAEQARNSGSYVIVSTKDDCSEPKKRSRIDAMRNALEGEPDADDIHLDFYDRSKLLQWLRQHPAVALWVRDLLGEPLSGWSPYGRWSNPPLDADDSLILEKGVTITLPKDRHERLTIKDAIAPLRELVQSSEKAIRIVGLSGVGKTRIVQALFDATAWAMIPSTEHPPFTPNWVLILILRQIQCWKDCWQKAEQRILCSTTVPPVFMALSRRGLLRPNPKSA